MNQSVVQNLDFYPYGQLNSTDSGITTHKFTGDERDGETGLDHTDFRQYASPQGRWMHPDPASLAAVDPTNPQSWNRYAYVLNSPLNLIDPTGLDCTTIWFDGGVEVICSGLGGELGGGGSGGVGTTNPCPLSVSLYDGDFYGIADAMDDGGANRIGGVPELSAENGNCRVGGAGSGNTSASGTTAPKQTQISPQAQSCVAQANQQVQNELQIFGAYSGIRLFGRIAIGAGFGALSVARWSKYGGTWGMAAGAAIGGTIGAVSVAWQDSRTIQNIQNSFIDKFQACMANGPAPPAPTP
jgi:RHS repeat-associated protein